MTWHVKTGWNIKNLGDTSGVQLHGLDDFPDRRPEVREKADAVLLDGLERHGVRAIFAENDLWTVLWVLLYWDQVFAKIPSSYEPLLGGPFPAEGNDIPQDLFGGNFYASHRHLYEERRAKLETLDLGPELRSGLATSRKHWTRLLDGAARYDDRMLDDVVEALPKNGLLRVLDRLWHDYKEHRRGLPDLLVLEPSIRLIEVKGPNDRLTKQQAAWLRYISSECDLPCEVLAIGWSSRKLANVRKLLSDEPISAGIVTQAQSNTSPDWQVMEEGRRMTEVLAASASAAEVPDSVFWADHIKTLRDAPEARLCCALAHRPLPAAYREALVALRAMVRSSRKSKRDWRPELTKLYRTAAESSLLWDTPYLDGIGPAFNVAETIPRETLDGLEFAYLQIGYEQISDLNQTDSKWLVEAWGEPERHQSAQVIHYELWSSAVAEYQRLTKTREEELAREWKQILASSDIEVTVSVTGDTKRKVRTTGDTRSRQGCSLALLVIVVAAALLAL